MIRKWRQKNTPEMLPRASRNPPQTTPKSKKNRIKIDTEITYEKKVEKAPTWTQEKTCLSKEREAR